MKNGYFAVALLRVERGQTFANSVLGQSSDAVNIEFLAYLPAMGFDRFHTSVEACGDLLRALAFGNQLQHFPFLR